MTIEFDGQNNKLGTTTADSVTIKTNDTDAITVDSSQNVGIGTSSPVGQLTLNKSSDLNFLQGGYGISWGATSGSAPRIIGSASSNIRFFHGGGSEAMRIDSSGHFLFAKTSTSSSVAGIRFAGDSAGYAEFTRDGGNPLYLNRETNDGDIIRFAKDDTTVGSISSQDGLTINIDGGGERAGIVFVSTAWFPRRNGALVDNTLDLGSGSYRFDDLFATNGTIQTSDQNEKQSIQSLTATEMAVAQRISKLFKTFKWNSAVEEKGDSARTHTGIIAQDVQQAFVDEGLDASNYALFISSTWWEKEISVDAVAPQEAVYETQTDEEGNEIQVLVQDAVEGKDAYTYIDTKDEATEGYTERTRLGIRYPELLSFVSSAFEQRLTNIETRLEALENV